MKNIEVKSLIIGALLTSTIFLGMGCESAMDRAARLSRFDCSAGATDKPEKAEVISHPDHVTPRTVR